MLEKIPFGPVGTDCSDFHPLNEMPLAWRIKHAIRALREGDNWRVISFTLWMVIVFVAGFVVCGITRIFA
jgi:hypothetical protein